MFPIPVYLFGILGALYVVPKIYKGYFPNYAQALIDVVNKINEKFTFPNAQKTGVFGNYGYGLDVASGLSNALIIKIIDAIHAQRLSGNFLWNNTEEYKKALQGGGTPSQISNRFNEIIQNKVTSLCTYLQKELSQYNLSIAQIRILYNGIDGVIAPKMGDIYTYFWGGRTLLDNVKLGSKIAIIGTGSYYGYKLYKGKLLK